MQEKFFYNFESALGEILLLSNGRELTGLYFDATKDKYADAKHDQAPFRLAIQELKAYFAGELKKFTVPVSQGGTDFQKRVWKQLCKVPYAKTKSYSDIADQISQPLASRAVGNANGKNNICIIVPCHRIIAADGSLGGYSAGLWRKEWLLKLETENS